jgi:hypothetical protein
MRALIVSFCFIVSLSHCYSHNAYFSFTELAYNEINGRFEASISVTTHDLEKALQQRGIIRKGLEYYQNDTLTLNKVYAEILNHFQIDFSKNPNFHSTLKIDGFEIMKTGLVYFYASMEVPEHVDSFQVTYDLLMDEYAEQQNKLTFIQQENKSTYIFTVEKPNTFIEIP